LDNVENLDPSLISLTIPSKAFAYEKISREIENIKDIEVVKKALRCYVKLYFKQQETLSIIGLPNTNDEQV